MPKLYRGTDSTVKIWSLSKCLASADESLNSLLAVLGNHSKSINIVRWSKTGDVLASGSDDSLVLIYRLHSSGAMLEASQLKITSSKVFTYNYGNV